MPRKPSPKLSGARTSDTHVTLLRGINVGGKNIVPMKDLVAMFIDAGCANVRSYIQSGNVIFTADPKCAKKVPEEVSKRIEKRFGIRVPVIMRSAKALHHVAANNPFLKRGADVTMLHVAFLADAPPARDIAALDPQRSPGDFFKVLGREIYLHLPNGVARTKLTNAYFDSKLHTISTVRNWRTVLKLIELANQNEGK